MIAIRRVAPFYFRAAELVLRGAVGGGFIYAGWLKVQDPVSFADSVSSFAILPTTLISAFALALPMFEILAGALLIIDWPRRIGALALTSLLSVFCIALTLAIVRGLDVNCGCFGASPSTTDPWIDLARDLAILAGCICLYLSAWLRGLVALPPESLIHA
jgi:putative oxidoreductase